MTFALIAVLPTAFAIPWTPDFEYEMYGPHLDNVHYVFTGSPENSFLGLDVGDYDIIDWACSKEWKDAWELPARDDIKVMGYGGEYGYYLLDVRCDPDKPINPPYSTQTYTLFGDAATVTIDLAGETAYTTTRAAAARRAMAHMIDRTWIVSTVMGGLGEPIYVPAPAAHGGFLSPNVDKYFQDFDKARELLDDAGVVDTGGDGWRDIPGTTTNLILDFFIRIGIPRELAGLQIAADIEAELDIQVNEQVGGSDLSFPIVMVNREMDMYTGGWIHVTFPDHYYDLYSEAGWYFPGFAPNYMKYCGPHPGGADPHFDEEINDLAKAITTSLDTDEVKAAAWAVQEKMMERQNVYAIGLVSTAAPKGFRTWKKGLAEVPGNEWKGIVNQIGQGANNWWTYLNAHTDNEPYGGSIFYGLSYSAVDFLNPIYANWYQSWEIMGTIYDGMLALDPMDRVTLKPWVAESFVHTKEYDPVQGEEVSVVYFTIRDDVYWQDGEQLTADDVIYTHVELVQALVDRGLPPASWDSLVRDINRIEKTDDFNIKAYYEFPTYFAPINVGGNIILPEHVWRDITHGPDGIPGTGDDGDPEAFAPDPNLIGSGPYQMDSTDYTEGVSADVYAYKPASAGYFAFSPVQGFVREAEKAEHSPNTNTYWVGASYVGAVKVVTETANADSVNSWAVTSALDEAGVPIGTQGFTIPAGPSVQGVRFNRAVAGGIGTVVGPFLFKVTDTGGWIPGTDVDTSQIVFKVTVDGDVISTGDNPGVTDVNVFDALRLVSNWGPTGPYRYPSADIDWSGSVNIFDALVIVGNFGAAGA
jgi:ABC-type transport system substrate-binding protein